MSAEERTGWRDQELSARHRVWGFNCPCVDGDFLVVEYDRARASLIVDYKYHRAAPLVEDANTEALGHLYTEHGEQLPFVIVRYWKPQPAWAFAVHPINTAAKRLLTGNVAMSEQAYVSWLYELRGHKAPPTLLRTLGALVPAAGYQMQRRWAA